MLSATGGCGRFVSSQNKHLKHGSLSYEMNDSLSQPSEFFFVWEVKGDSQPPRCGLAMQVGAIKEGEPTPREASLL
jgi:hypothetical protein